MFKILFKTVDIAPIAIFRIFLGFLLFAESIGAILTGWVQRTMIIPKFTFSHIGFEWLQPLPGNGMYYYYIIMGFFGFLVMLGYKYRWSLSAFTILWAGVYFMQKETYNNHYYLLMLVCLIMLFLPAGNYASIDVKQNPEIKKESMPRWCSVVMIFQITIVYVFAVVSKLYPQWLDGSFIKILLSDPNNPAFVAGIFDKHWFHIFIAWSGLLFDLLIVPLLLWKRTRTIAFICAIFFHLFNAIVLQIGIFPFFALSFIVFFYPSEKIRRVFFRKKAPVDPNQNSYIGKPALLYFFIPYLILQIALPLRHYFIPGDVLWTEEGHRLSWRMMLRQKNGFITYRIVNNTTNETTFYNLEKELTPKQQRFVATKPDGIWQLAQRIKKQYNEQGQDISIYINSQISINGSPYRNFIDPKTDLAKAKWEHFKHNHWILPETGKTSNP